MASVPAGTRLGKYEVVKPLASGGMAELLLARTAPAERPLVLKWLRPEQAIDGTFVETFTREAKRAAQLHHSNIVEVREVGREDGTHFLAMEYVHGDDLRKLLARLHERRAKLPVQHLLAIATAVAGALHHAHETDVLHLGVKPANVMITADGAVKVTDFGIGRAALTEGRTDLLPSIVGYLSPEQCTGQAVDRRSDVFGLGILMYELATGRRLFKSGNEFATMASIVAGDIPPPTKHRGDLPKELEAVIMKALARAPEDRYQTALEMQQAIDKFATKAGVRGSLTTLAGYTKRLFGVRPEPWLADDDTAQSGPTSIDFDGAPKGLAMPPPEAAKACALPSYVTAADDSPIMRLRKQVSRDMPTEQLNLAALKASVPDKSAPVKIPAANGTSARPAKATRAPAVPAPTAQPARAKPKTVQIPVVAIDKKEESTKVLTRAAQPIDDDNDHTEVNPHDKVVEENTTPAAKPVFEPQARKPQLVALAGLAEADAKREAAKQAAAAQRKADDAARLPKPGVAGEIKPPVVAAKRIETATDEIDVELDAITAVEGAPTIVEKPTAVALPPPAVATTKPAREATEHVVPLPAPRVSTTSATTEVATAGNKKWYVLAGLAAAAAIAVAIVIGFGGDGPSSTSTSTSAAPVENTAAAEPPTPEQPKSDEPPPPAEDTQLRSSSEPRTPRNSGVTTDDQVPVDEPAPAPEPAPEPPKSDAPTPEPKVEEPKLAVEPPPAPKFEEPKDPSPPDEEIEPPPKKPPPKVVAKPKPKPKSTALAPKPKPKAKAKPKPTAKPAGKWDPNALFPTKK